MGKYPKERSLEIKQVEGQISPENGVWDAVIIVCEASGDGQRPSTSTVSAYAVSNVMDGVHNLEPKYMGEENRDAFLNYWKNFLSENYDKFVEKFYPIYRKGGNALKINEFMELFNAD